MYADAMAKMLEIHPDPLDWPPSAMEDLGDALQASGLGEPGIKMSMSAVRQWVTWARENGIQVPELRNPAPGRWRAKLEDVAKKWVGPAESPPADDAPPTDVAGSPEWGSREAVDEAARQAAREKRAADRAVAQMRQRSQQASAQRQGRLTKLLPEQSTLVVQRRGVMGDLINVNEYSQRDVAQSQTIEGFLRRWVQPHHEAPYEYVLTEILPNGDVRPAYNVKLDPPLEDASMNAVNGAQAAAASVANEVRKALDPDEQIARLTRWRAALAPPEDGAAPDPMARMFAMFEMKQMHRVMSDMFDPPPPPVAGMAGPPPPDPELQALRAEVKALGEALKSRGQAAEMLAIIKAAQEPLIAIMTSEGRRKGGGVSELLEMVQGLKALGIPIGAAKEDDGGGALVKLSSNIVAAIKEVGKIQASPKAAAPDEKFVPPPGFKEKCAELANAKDDETRVGAAAEALEILATKSTDRRWGMLLLDIARKGKAAHQAEDEGAREAGRTELIDLIGQILDSIREEGFIDGPTKDATVKAFTANIASFCERMSMVPGI